MGWGGGKGVLSIKCSSGNLQVKCIIGHELLVNSVHLFHHHTFPLPSSLQAPPPCSINDVPQGYSVKLQGPSSSSSSSLVYQTPVGTTSYTFSNLLPNQTYFVEVAVRTATAIGPFSATLSVATPGQPMAFKAPPSLTCLYTYVYM